MTFQRPFQVRLGIGFLIWFFALSLYSVLHYGIAQGNFLWMDSLVLLGVGIALLKESRAIASLTLALGLVNQLLLSIDNFSRAVFKFDLLGLSEFLYQPGMGGFDFLLHHSHWFTLPTLIVCLALWKRNAKETRKMVLLAGGAQALLLVASYFLFPESANVNCSHAPCYPPLEQWQGKPYTISFILLNTLLAMGIAFGLQQFGRTRVPVSKAFRLRMNRGFAAAVLFATLFTTYDVIYRGTLPKLVCESGSENQDVKIGCKYTTDYTRNWLFLSYEMFNKHNSARNCASYIEVDGKKDLLQESLILIPKRETQYGILIPYPKKDMNFKLSAECSKL